MPAAPSPIEPVGTSLGAPTGRPSDTAAALTEPRVEAITAAPASAAACIPIGEGVEAVAGAGRTSGPPAGVADASRAASTRFC